MSNPILDTATNNKPRHYSVGALIKQDGKYLLIDRVKTPFGFAGLAGHVDIGETPEQALVREVEEESGLKVKNYKLLMGEELDWDTCSKGIEVHYWYLYECEIAGEVIQNKIETKSINWYTLEEMKKLNLQNVWEYWFKKLKII
jgi:8-oxo-dGTP pyrophosphatase MutT (NUDIX family)